MTERQTHAEAYVLHHDLLRLRREDAAFRSQRPHGVDGAVLSPQAFAIRFFADDHRDERILIVNLGRDLTRRSFAEPLLAPPGSELEWSIHWSSEDIAYGGSGTPPFWAKDYADRAIPEAGAADSYVIAGESALVLKPGPRLPEQLRSGIRVARHDP